MERVQERGSSRGNKIRYVPRGNFAQAAMGLYSSENKCRAVYTEAPQSRLAFANVSPEVIEILGSLTVVFPFKASELSNAFATKREQLHNHFKFFDTKHEDLHSALDLLNTIEAAAHEMVKGFYGYDVFFLGLRANYEGGEREGTSNMHQDSSKNNKDTIILTSTFWGESTVYQSKDEEDIHLPPQSLCAHIGSNNKNVIVHRSPHYHKSRDRRICLVVGLVPR